MKKYFHILFFLPGVLYVFLFKNSCSQNCQFSQGINNSGNSLTGIKVKFIGSEDKITTDKEGEVINEDTFTYDYILFMKNITVNAGIVFKFFKKKLSLSPNLQHIGEREGAFARNTAGHAVGEFLNIDAYALFNLAAIYKISEKLKLSVSGLNLLDAQYFYPEDVCRRIPTVPGRTRTGLFAKLRYTF